MPSRLCDGSDWNPCLATLTALNARVSKGVPAPPQRLSPIDPYRMFLFSFFYSPPLPKSLDASNAHCTGDRKSMPSRVPCGVYLLAETLDEHEKSHSKHLLRMYSQNKTI